MPGSTVTDEVELIGTGKGGGGGSSGDDGSFGGGGDDWKGPSGSARVPQRAYVTGMTIALAGILMFFMALVSACLLYTSRCV